MAYCTIVEFEWDETFDHSGFSSLIAEEQNPPPGRISRIAGIGSTGARMIEVWRSSDDARAFAEQSGPALADAALPSPSRVTGFDVTTYTVS